MANKHWDADTVLHSLQARQQLRRQRRWHRSQLDPYTTELTTLRERGATLSQMRLFLSDHHLKVERSTIMRWLDKHNVKPLT